jgi:hypothetical protein
MTNTLRLGYSLMGGTNCNTKGGEWAGYMQIKYCSFYYSEKTLLLFATVCVFADNTVVFTILFYSILQHSIVSMIEGY